jgi:dihydrodipicolinate synthase/N-acetylneuraminate lyase
MVRRLTGLIAAVYTPMHADGSLNLDVAAPAGLLFLNGATDD